LPHIGRHSRKAYIELQLLYCISATLAIMQAIANIQAML
jgi:hypothetical protein